MKFSRTWFDRNVEQALTDAGMRAATLKTARAKIASRAEAVAAVSEFDDLRDLAARIKQHTVEHLDDYVQQFSTRVQELGGHVHVAADAEEARRIIVRIGRENGLKLCVKVKSMATEEVELNAALAAGGIRPVETDLGEFIVQLDRDRPSHIVTPIIHKNRQVIARAMARELGVPYTEDPGEITGHARHYLREVFRNCDMGVTGANFAVAETGTLSICTNEGNGRLSTTRPRVLVALVGMEKLIPRMGDLPVMLKVLSRSSTGQPLTVYNTLVNGPRRQADPDGPRQLHVVLLDNGRRAIARSEYRDVLRCIRCGACLNACPVFRQIGGHAYGSVYPGPIGKLISPLLKDHDHYADLPQASSLCGMCYDVCPVRIDIPSVLVRLRRDQVQRGAIPWLRRVAFGGMFQVLSSPWLLSVARRVARWGTAIGARGDWNRALPGPGRRLTQHRDTPRPAARSFRELWKEEQKRPTAVVNSPEPPGQSLPIRENPVEPQASIPDELPPAQPERVRRLGPDADLVAEFEQRATQAGMHVHRSTPDDLGRDVAALVRTIGETRGSHSIRVLIEPTVDQHQALQRVVSDVATITDPADGDDVLFAADVGITNVIAGVAEFGSLVCRSGDGHWRSLSLLPMVHIAVLPQERIVPDLVDLFGAKLPDPLPANLTLITGPSKTADVEGILITGVHGPGHVHVVLV